MVFWHDRNTGQVITTTAFLKKKCHVVPRVARVKQKGNNSVYLCKAKSRTALVWMVKVSGVNLGQPGASGFTVNTHTYS